MAKRERRRHRGDVDRRKVCVIGAGLSGLITMKELLDENHAVVCYEKQSREGGVFNLDDRTGNTAYDSTLLTISNYAMAFSCFPPEEHEERRFWTVREYQRYLSRFARHFHLEDCVQFDTEVLAVETWKGSKYLVRTRQGDTERVEVFDAVAVCAGAFQRPKLPALPFVGPQEVEVLHSVDYRRPEPFFGKRVLCVGLGESGADIVHEIALTADDAMLSVRPAPPPLIPRYDCEHLGAIPNDGETTTHRYGAFKNQFKSIFNRTKGGVDVHQTVRDNPDAFPMDLPEGASRDERIEAFIAAWNRRSYAGGLPFVSRFLTKNTVFVEDVVEGRLGVCFSPIERIEGETVTFEDGTQFSADTLMCCTGYADESNPLFTGDDTLRPHLGGPTNPRAWFKHMIHPKVGKGIAFIGYARPTQGLLPACSELQARYFALLCSNRRRLPDDLAARTARENAEEARMIQGDPRVTTLVQYPYFAEEMAALIGCRPGLRTRLKDPALAYKLFFGAKVPPVFRLDGPHARPELARRVLKKLPVADTLRGQIATGLLNIRALYELHAAGTLAVDAIRAWRDVVRGEDPDAADDPGFHAWGVGQLRPTLPRREDGAKSRARWASRGERQGQARSPQSTGG